jgi:hypothetical protein
MLKHKRMFYLACDLHLGACDIKAFKSIFRLEIKKVTEGWAMWHNWELQFIVSKPDPGG